MSCLFEIFVSSFGTIACSSELESALMSYDYLIYFYFPS